MKYIALSTVLLLGSSPQDPTALIEQLRSDDLMSRERAFAELEKLGAAAEEALKKAAKDPDAGVAHAIGQLLRIVDLERSLPAALKKDFPGLASRLGRSSGEDWTAVYLEVGRSDYEPDPAKPGRFADLTREDLEPLAVTAVRSARTPADRAEAFRRALQWNHRSILPVAVELLTDPDEDVREFARECVRRFADRTALATFLDRLAAHPAWLIEALEELNHPVEALDALRDLLRKGDDDTCYGITERITRLGVRDALAEVPALLKSDKERSRWCGLILLRSLGDRREQLAAIPLLADPKPDVRRAAIETLSSEGEVPVEALARLLKDEDAEVVETAAEACRETTDPKILPALRELVTHSEESVAMEALQALSRLKDPELADISIRVLEREPGSDYLKLTAIGELKAAAPARAPAVLLPIARGTGSSFVRASAIGALVGLKAITPDDLKTFIRDDNKKFAAAVAQRVALTHPELLKGEWSKLLADPATHDELVHDHVLEAIGPPEERIPILLEAARAPEGNRYRIFRAIENARPVFAAAELKAMASEDDEVLRSHAIRILATFSGPESAAWFEALLEDPEASVRGAAVEALRKTGFSKWEAVAKRAEDEDEGVRVEAAYTLWRHFRPEMVPAFEKLLRSKERMECWPAAAALMELGHVPTIKVLVDSLSNPSSELCRVARALLQVFDRPETRARIPGLLRHRLGNVRSMGADLFGRWGTRADAGVLLPLLPEQACGGAAAQAIINLGARELIPELLKLLDHPLDAARENALTALVGLGATEAAPLIRGLLKDSSCDLRLSAIGALGTLRDRDAVAPFIVLLKDRYPPVRAAAARALGRIGDPSAGPAIVELMDDRTWDVRETAIDSVRRLKCVEALPRLWRLLDEPRTSDEGLAGLVAIGGPDVAAELLKRLETDKENRVELAEALASLKVKEAAPIIRRFMESPEEPQWRRQALALPLADLGDPSGLKPLLRDKNRWQRHGAVRRLAAAGDSEAIATIVDSEDSRPDWLAALNGVRNPDGWKALGEHRFEYATGVSRRRLLEELKVGSRRFRFEGLETFEQRSWLETRLWRDEDEDPTGPDALAEILDGVEYVIEDLIGEPEYTYVIEEDVIRIMSVVEARKFWKQWWIGVKNKK